ncbi:MAG: hypothetical protein AAGC74_08590 [Verrucomicrobiota bacterium]
MLGYDPINIHFSIPPRDHLGREEVDGHLRFHADHIDLHWRVKGNVFTGRNEMELIEIPYSAVERVEFKKRWFLPPILTLRLEDPSLTAAIPGVDAGKMILRIDPQSKEDVKKLDNLIDFRRSMFLLDETNKRLQNLKDA